MRKALHVIASSALFLLGTQLLAQQVTLSGRVKLVSSEKQNESSRAGGVVVWLTPLDSHAALKPFPAPVRTLDAIHLAAIEFIRSQGASVQLASYDQRLIGVARLLGIAEWNM